MAKLVNRGFTDYINEKILPVLILSWDGNKWAKVRLADGTETEVPMSTVFRTETLKGRIPEVDRFILAGGKRHQFKNRERKVTYTIHNSSGHDTFSTKKEAIRVGIARARRENCKVEVASYEVSRYSSIGGNSVVSCSPLGTARQWDSHTSSKRRRAVKYLRGYGKVMGRLPNGKTVLDYS